MWLSAITVVLVVPYCLRRSLPSGPPLNLSNLKESARYPFDSLENPLKRTHDIPNIVHFVHLLNLKENQTFEFPFRQFVAIYSAHYYLQPDAIYIHTNVPEDQIKEKIQESNSPYTQAVTQLPRLKFKYHLAPNTTSRNYTIENFPNQSDFIRTSVLVEHGGIYLDDDVSILRDLKPLRQMGFENVIGFQGGSAICPAVILATKGSKMMNTYHELQDIVFDGSWANHAVELLSTLAREFSPYPHQVLVMPTATFFPHSWLPDSLRTIYQVNRTRPEKPMENNRPLEDISDFIEHFEQRQPSRPKDTWQVDWRLSYTLHGWNHAVEILVHEDEEKKIDSIFGSYGHINLEYVLAQNSNFARAVYPAIRHAVDRGVLDAVKFERNLL